MNSLNIEAFNPKKAELIALADSCKNLVIKDIDDYAGYTLVDFKRKEAKKAKSSIKIAGMALRREAIDFQNAVREKEKEFLEIIEPVEKALQEKQDEIDHLRLIQSRKNSIPDREEKLKAVSAEYKVEDLLEMDEVQFETFLNIKTREELEEKQRNLDKEKAEIEAQKNKEAEEKVEAEKKKEAEEKRQSELIEAGEKAVKETAEKAKKDKEDAAKKAEEDKFKAIEEERQKAADRESIIREEQEAKDQSRIKKEVEEHHAKEKEEAERKEAQENIEKDKKYKDFLKKNGVVKGQNDGNFYFERKGTVLILYKKIDEIEI